jgi:hypothetical protein
MIRSAVNESFFNKSFKEYLNYYTLEEATLMSIPNQVMGLTSSVNPLPETEPYGMWVDKSGNFIIVPYESHWEVADKICEAAKIYAKKHGIQLSIPNNMVDPYEILWSFGWARIVLYDNVYYQIGDKRTKLNPTAKQLQFFERLRRNYNLKEIIS